MVSIEIGRNVLTPQRVSLILNILCLFQLIFLYYALFNGQQAERTAYLTPCPHFSTLSSQTDHKNPKPIIYMITPTVDQPVRKADFTRLAQTLVQVPNLHWIVVEDGNKTCPCVTNILRRLIKKFTYFTAPTPPYAYAANISTQIKNKGIFQRNAGLQWIRQKYWSTRKGHIPTGVVYFGDDDNTYDLRLFDIIRSVDKVGVWPVAFVGSIMLEKPIANRSTGRLVGFDVHFDPDRKFAVDMAGFALGLHLVLSKPDATFPLESPQYWMEPALLNAFNLNFDDIQVLGMNVRTPEGLLEPLVWHTKTTPIDLSGEGPYSERRNNKTSDDGWDV